MEEFSFLRLVRQDVDDCASVCVAVLPGGGDGQEPAGRVRGGVGGVALPAAAADGRSACVCAAQGLRGGRTAAIVVRLVQL